MAAKFYAVRKGRKTGIFRTWDECRASVHGFSGPEYKSFGTLEEAQTFLQGVQKEEVEEDRLRIYVDGSFHAGTGEFSYGMVVLIDGREEKFSQKISDPELAQMRNVAGEIKGSEAAMQYALDHKIPSIIIYHDYQGIASWCNGDWKANKAGTIAYRDFYQKAKKSVHIEFRKVKGHSNDKYNDMVDELAKEALGIH